MAKSSCNDRPGRWAALLVATPLFVVGATQVLDCQPWVAIGMYIFAAILFVYELFWICAYQRYEAFYIRSSGSGMSSVDVCR